MELNLYTREGCHLCHRLEQLLAPWIEQGAIAIKHRDIETNEAWYEMYWSRIPVLTQADHVILEGKPEEVQVRETMNALVA